MTRICITGGPRAGKTTMARGMLAVMLRDWDKPIVDIEGPVQMCTDDVMHLGWSESSARVAVWLDTAGSWIIEGVAVSRALRKWREAHPGEPPPVDRVIYLNEPYETLGKGQATMAKGVRTVHDEIEGWLDEHGVKTEYL